MDITGLNATEVSRIMEKHVADYLEGFKLSEGASLFQENFLLHHDEVKEAIPKQRRHLFTAADKFNASSGFLGDSEKIVMLIASADNTQALFLLVRDANTQHDTLLADFTS